MIVRLALCGRNYDATAQVPGELSLPEGCSVTEALAAVARCLSQGDRLPESCLVAVSGVHLGTVARHRPQTLREGDELMVLAPVAGG